MDGKVLFSEHIAKLNTVKDLIDIKPAFDDREDTLMPNYAELARASVLLPKMLQEYKEDKNDSQQLTNELQELLKEMKVVGGEIQTLSAKVPKYLPGQKLVIETQESQPMSSKGTPAGVKPGPKKPAVSKSAGGRQKAKKSPPPQLPYITAKEFTSVPNYMKGRILYSDVNKAIDIVNQSADEKYKIVNKQKPLSDYHRRKKIDFQELEGKDTENTHFITDADITEFTSVKIDKRFLSWLVILRHCGRIKQQRSGKITKHVLVPA